MKKYDNVYKVLEGLEKKRKAIKEDLILITDTEKYKDKLEDLQIIEKQIFILNESLDIIFEYEWANN